MKAYRPHSGWKSKLHEIIYEADTPAGKLFDIVLFFLIILSVILVMLESIEEVDQNHHRLLLTLEWCITIFFSLEYIARLISIKKPWKYVFSFYGIIDFLSTIPLYLSYILAGSQVLLAVRAFRLLRVFRILKLVKFIGEASQLQSALKASRTKIAVFIYVVLILSVILGTLMYLVEGDEAGFTSIPRSIYWAIVTITTVGYGDVYPVTSLGKFLSGIIAIVGIGFVALPTGIISTSFMNKVQTQNKLNKEKLTCSHCGNKI